MHMQVIKAQISREFYFRPIVLILGLALAACAQQANLEQGRICRIVLPAISPSDAQIYIVATKGETRGSGIEVDYFLQSQSGRSSLKVVHCQFEGAANLLGQFRLTRLETDDGLMSEAQLFFLQRFWLDTSAAWISDPEPVAGARRARQVPGWLAYGLQQIINALPLAAIYSLLAAAYSLVYGLVGRINLAFGEFAAIGGYAAIFGATMAGGDGPFALLFLALVFGTGAAMMHGIVAGRLVFSPLANANRQTGLVATIGLALFLQEYLRLTQGSVPNWLGPVLAGPVPLVRAGDFVVTVTPMNLLTAGLAALSACAVLVLMQFSRFGRNWRAYADDSRAAILFGVSPRAIFTQTFALACALAGLSGALMTLYFGAFGYGGGVALGLKALIAAILGGIGSIPGAFLGGLAIGMFEATWQALFPGEYRDLAVYLILVALLMFRPGGFLGFANLQPRGV